MYSQEDIDAVVAEGKHQRNQARMSTMFTVVISALTAATSAFPVDDSTFTGKAIAMAIGGVGIAFMGASLIKESTKAASLEVFARQMKAEASRPENAPVDTAAKNPRYTK